MKSSQNITAANAIWAISSALIIFLFVNWLNWPLLASFVLGIALFVHVIYMSKVLYTYYHKAVNKGLIQEYSVWLFNFKKVFLGTGKESESEA